MSFRLQISTLLFLLILPLGSTTAQERLFPLPDNPVLTDRPQQSDLLLKRKKKGGVDTLSLPFIDDFSYDEVYPDSTRWMDKQAYVNRHYAVTPPTIGVATLDGLNELGHAYSIGNNKYGPADTLTSLPIDLSSFVSNDSIFLSFFYQPQGIGDNPNPDDSLVLEFKPGNDTTWNHIWSIPGDTFRPFRQKIFPVTDPAYLHNAFQFRFRNYATISGNNDHWHIDYIRLDQNRTADDTILNDVAVAAIPITILKNFTFMPWDQFKANANNELKSKHRFSVRNNFSSTKSFNYGFYTIYVNTGQPIDSSASGLTDNISPFTTVEKSFNQDTIPFFNADSVLLRTLYHVSATGDIHRVNDTFPSFQPFYNYFAYDDGSAEKAYGTYSSGSKVALQYKVNKPDTLTGIFMHFTHMNKDVSDKLFSLTIWSSITTGSSDEQMIYQKDFQTPNYTDRINGFYLYTIDTPIVISGEFLVGWQQTNAEILRIGFDRNTDFSQHAFYNADGTWKQSSFDGSLMIRPVFDKKLLAHTSAALQNTPDVTLYPIPTQHRLFIDLPPTLNHTTTITLLNMTGQIKRKKTGHTNSIDLRELPPGIYLLKIESSKLTKPVVKKVIVQ